MSDHTRPEDSGLAPSETVESPGQVLELLADDAARQILLATANGYLPVADLSHQCEIPIATAYRKVNDLAEQGLLLESVRVRPHGRNVSVYMARPVGIHLRLPDGFLRLRKIRGESPALEGRG